MEYESCPRCRGNWEESTFTINDVKIPYKHCTICDVRFFPDRGELILRNMLKPNYHLVWYRNETYCRYGSLEEALRENTLKLPLLPISISKERLKLILLFS